MPTDIEQQLAQFAEALDRDAPAISFDDMIGRGSVALDVDLLARPSSDHSSYVNFAPLVDTTPNHDEIDEIDEGLIELSPALVVRRPVWRRTALKAALAAAAVTVVVGIAAIQRGGNELDVADDFPSLTTTFVSPRNGFSVKHPGGSAITPATEDGEDGFDVVDTGLAAVFEGTSTEFLNEVMTDETGRTVGPDEQIDGLFSDDSVFAGGCGVPRSQQARITIDGRRGRIAECPNRIEATVVAAGKLYVFTLSHDRSDARAVFDAFVATIDLKPETAIHFPAMTTTFVSPTYGYSFKYFDRGGFAPATGRWDPGDDQLDSVQFGDGFDANETGMSAYFASASTAIPDGVSIDEWYDENLSSSGCSVPRSQQPEITIDGQSGRIAECPNRIEATVVAGGRLYIFKLGHERIDARAWFDAWIATIDLTPETAT